MSSEQIKEIKEKILNWLKEEKLQPREISDPNAYFNICITVGGLALHVIQKADQIDSIAVGANLVFTEEQLKLLENMSDKKRQEFFWELRLALLKNNELGDFQIKPNPPHDVKEVFISSRRLFYDGLTKDRLMTAIFTVYKAIFMVIWMLEQKAGTIKPKDERIGYL